MGSEAWQAMPLAMRNEWPSSGLLKHQSLMQIQEGGYVSMFAASARSEVGIKKSR